MSGVAGDRQPTHGSAVGLSDGPALALFLVEERPWHVHGLRPQEARCCSRGFGEPFRREAPRGPGTGEWADQCRVRLIEAVASAAAGAGRDDLGRYVQAAHALETAEIEEFERAEAFDVLQKQLASCADGR